MIARLIHWSLRNRLLVVMVALLLAGWGAVVARNTPLNALPDLSDVQVIVHATWPGQAPQVMEDQVTYPLTTTMMSVPGATTVRGISMFGESFVYVLFKDRTDLYWARSRVLEYLSQVSSQLPSNVEVALGPDATGVGWIYEYALVDRTGRHDLSQLRAIQDWYLRYALKTVPNVSEVATVGGKVREYQIVLDPDRLRAYGIPLGRIEAAMKGANNEVGGSVIEQGETEYMVRAHGYLKTLADFRAIPLGVGPGGTPITLGDVARIQRGPSLRRGIAELNGDGQVVGGVVVLRFHQNALATLDALHARIQQVQKTLPKGVEIVPTYDQSGLIHRAVTNLGEKLIEELLIVAAVCMLFLFHIRSALVAVVTLPLGILVAFIIMDAQGIDANIMSLGGIAIAIGEMVDAAVVMIENAHRKLEAWRCEHGAEAVLESARRLNLIADAATEVGPALFFSLLILALSFVPILALQGESGRLFSPLAYTKTYAVAVAAALSVTLVPVLMAAFIRGRLRAENANPLNRALTATYRPLLRLVLAAPWPTLGVAVVVLGVSVIPFSRLGSEFMPPLNEGDLMYMPSALPGLSVGKAAQLLQQTDRILKTFPEVQTVFGKAGRAETSTDPAPLDMFETILQLKPQNEWPAGMTQKKLIAEMNAALQIPGLSNIFVQPIRDRINMLSTGLKSPVGVKITGPDLATIAGIGQQVERVVKVVLGTASAFAQRVDGGHYIDIRPDRQAAARYGLNIDDLQRIIRLAVGGEPIGRTVEGLQRFPINLRYPHALRDSASALRILPIVTPSGATVTLGQVADIRFTNGPPMIASEDARPTGFVYIDLQPGRDLGRYVADARRAVAEKVTLPPGYDIHWAGEYQQLQRGVQRLKLIVPFTLLLIFLLLFLIFRDLVSALLILGTLPFALVGGVWLVWLLGENLSIASAVGFIGLTGIASEFGVVMLVYIHHAVNERRAAGRLRNRQELREAIRDGALLRLRPLAMTATVVVAGLLPLFFGQGTGSHMMQTVAAPMVGGMLSAAVLTMLVLPAAYWLIERRHLPAAAQAPVDTPDRKVRHE
ncbi:MAG: efflux RND transporter permease subunit [Nevskiaceae bacterium]|nr:MAG: efflux RND transporter permease subunit [Nevskiaceae bacterium]TBR72561.1 MAG: efflux RND transporter permease subunit [Nevskiaceae bacterium]